jgi:Domain of unknown function (DUF4290)
MKKDRMLPTDIAYNTSHEQLIMPEYGRNVQQLVRHAQQIKDSAYRQQFCEEIIDLIQQLYPQAKNVEDYRSKLWQHLFHIAKYNLDAVTPTGVVPTPETARKKPERVPYPQQDTRFRHYGNNLHKLILRARDMDAGPIKDGFVHTIGSYMKLAYKTWNREHYVSDEIIKTDLDILSNGRLSLEENSRIDGLANSTRNRRESDRNERNNAGRDNNRSGGSQSRSNSGGKDRDSRSSSSSRDNQRNDNRNDNRNDSRSSNNVRNDNRNDNRNDSRSNNNPRNDNRSGNSNMNPNNRNSNIKKK